MNPEQPHSSHSDKQERREALGLETPSLEDVNVNGETLRKLSITKNGRVFELNCRHGQEVELLEQLRLVAQDPDIDLTMFDVAKLSHELGELLRQQVNQFIEQEHLKPVIRKAEQRESA